MTQEMTAEQFKLERFKENTSRRFAAYEDRIATLETQIAMLEQQLKDAEGEEDQKGSPELPPPPPSDE